MLTRSQSIRMKCSTNCVLEPAGSCPKRDPFVFWKHVINNDQEVNQIVQSKYEKTQHNTKFQILLALIGADNRMDDADEPWIDDVQPSLWKSALDVMRLAFQISVFRSRSKNELISNIES